MPYVRKTKRRKSKTKGARIVAIASGLVAIGLVFGGLYLKQQENLDANAAEASTYAPSTIAPITEDPSDTAGVPAADPREVITGTDDITISVLGDSTGNEDGEWVTLWAEHLAEEANVSLRVWNETTNSYLLEPIQLGEGDRTITIWNGSQNGAAPQYALGRLGNIQPQEPDLVIYNYGHNPSTGSYDTDLTDLQDRIEQRWGATPTVVTLQNPAQGTRETVSTDNRTASQAWAEQNGLPVVNAFTAFEDAGGAPALLQDEVHPNPEGSRVWADQVIQTLG